MPRFAHGVYCGGGGGGDELRCGKGLGTGRGKWVLWWEGRRGEWVSSYDGFLLRGTVGVVCSFGRDRDGGG